MQIFDSEKQDGLEDLLNTKASVSYASVAEPCSFSDKQNIHINNKIIANYQDSDLYYVQSILVTSSWNKNDDIFDKEEVWKAKNTPEDKPTNLEHDESIIIGHITSNWPMTEDGLVIDQDIPVKDIPNKFHILTGSVIYRGFSNPELRDRAEKLISEIENGTKYVSMECFFKGFDYGLIHETSGEYKVLSRNENTAYLTKYLRAYGGEGKHQNYKIGRVLRNITFTGKGFVNKPANEDSIIFTKNLLSKKNKASTKNDPVEKNEEIIEIGVSNSQSNIQSENKIMSSDNTSVENKEHFINLSPDKVVDNKTETVSAEVVSDLNNQITSLKSSYEQLNKTNKQLSSDLADLLSQKEEAAKKMDEEKKKTKETMEKMKADLDAANEVIAAYKSEKEEMMKKDKKTKRMATLIEAGLDEETAKSTIDRFESLDDESFEAMTLVMAAMKKKKEDAVMMPPKKPMASTENTDTSLLENVESEEDTTLSVGGEEESQTESTRAELASFLRSRFSKKSKLSK